MKNMFVLHTTSEDVIAIASSMQRCNERCESECRAAEKYTCSPYVTAEQFWHTTAIRPICRISIGEKSKHFEQRDAIFRGISFCLII